MIHGRHTPARIPRLGGAALVAAVCALTVGQTARAQEDAPVNTGALSLSAGVDFVSQYWFRGMAQENQGFIAQPWIDVSLNLGPFGLDHVDLYGGVWNSIHQNDFILDVDGDGENDGDQSGLFETDWYVGASVALPADFTLDVSFISLHAPSTGDIFAEEVDIGLSYDDSALWGEGMPEGWGGLQPHVLVAFETAGGSDAGSELGTYLELGVSPGFTLIHSEDMPVDLSVPMAAGFSLDDYYEDGTGDDEAFGFFDVGLELSVPLNFMPAEVGSWSAYAGVHGIFLGDSTSEISGTDFGIISPDSDVEAYGVFGISMTY
jgi:hypothetical protein